MIFLKILSVKVPSKKIFQRHFAGSPDEDL